MNKTRWTIFPPLLWVAIAIGILLRLWTLAYSVDLHLPPDLWGYFSLAETMKHPYDTSIREPLFVWICWFVQVFTDDPRNVFTVLRVAGIVCYVLISLLTYHLGRRLFSVPVAVGACFLLAINWSQIENDLNGLRNPWEGLLLAGMVYILFRENLTFRRWGLLTLLGALFTLLKVTFLPTAGLLYAIWFWVRRWSLWKAAVTLAIMFLAIAPHFLNNKKIAGDYFYSTNYLTRNFRNVEFAGMPGFPTKEEVILDAFAGPPVTTFEIMFKLHSPWKAVYHTVEGTFGLLWGTITTRFFAKNTSWLLYSILLPCYLIGTVQLMRIRDGRLLLALLVCFVLPFAFFKHVYWSYRYLVPLAPLVSLTAFFGLATATRTFRRWCSRRSAGPDVRAVKDSRSAEIPLISFLVPAYNEAETITEVLRKVSTLPFSKEVIVVDDGSRDETRSILTEYQGANTLVLFHEKNAGKGAAVQTALAHARGEYIAIQDADDEYDPSEYPILVETLRASGASAVFGSRFLTENPSLYRRYRLGNKVMTAGLNFLCASRYTDTYTCYKLVQASLFKNLAVRSSGFEMEAEISVKLAMRDVRVAECAIHYRPRSLEQGKKIGWRDALKGAVATLVFWWEEGNRTIFDVNRGTVS